MEKLFSGIEEQIGEAQAIIGLVSNTVEIVANSVSSGELPHYRLSYDALTGMQLLEDKLTAIVTKIYESNKTAQGA